MSCRQAGVAARISQCPPIENGRRAVAHRAEDLLHLAGPVVSAIRAPTILRLADARKQGQRPFHQPHHTAKGNGFGALRKLVSTASPTLTADQSIALQLDENGFQELARNSASGRNGGRRKARARGKCGKFQQGLQRVTSFLREQGGANPFSLTALCQFSIWSVQFSICHVSLNSYNPYSFTRYFRIHR